MLELKIFNLLEAVYQAVFKRVAARLDNKISKVGAVMDAANRSAESDYYFANMMKRRADDRRIETALKCMDKKAKLDQVKQHISKIAGV